MRKPIIFLPAILLLLLLNAGCNSQNDENVLNDRQSAQSYPDEEVNVDENQMRWDAIPAVFVNDTYFRIYDDRQEYVPLIDDTWDCLGDIQTAVPSYESPTVNFQTNHELMVGAEIYHSPESRISVTVSTWNDPIDEVVIGESIIVVFQGQRLWYITENAHDEVIQVMEGSAVRSSLMVDGEIYSLMGTAGGSSFTFNDSYIFIGEVIDAVPMNEYPTENLQANRDVVVGTQAYWLPSEDGSDIVLFHDIGFGYYYKLLPGTSLP